MTLLEENAIRLCNAVKEKVHHDNIKIKNIDKIIDTMIHSLDNDKKLGDIYGKKHVTVAALNHMFNNMHDNMHDNMHNNDHKKIISAYDDIIEKKIYISNYIKEKKERKCCKKCIIC
jgi:hypothetical protein